MRDVTLKDQDGDRFYDKLQFKFLQMPLFNKTESELGTQQDKWLYFLKNLTDFDSIPSILREPVFEKAFHTAELAAMSKEDRDKYEANLQIYRDNHAAMETARLEGKEEGEAIGREIGREEGREIGRKEGREEGIAESIVLLLEDRFGAVPVSIISALNGIADFAVLQSLIIKASRCSSLDEFEAALRQQVSTEQVYGC